MPELPEVEVTRRSIAEVCGSQVLALRLGKPLRWPLGVAPDQLVGARVGEIARRGKYLWLPLHHGRHEGGGLLWHLGMSGSLSWWPQGQAVPDAGPHDHAALLTDRGLLRLRDPRRFGAVVWSASLQHDPARKLLANLGFEPFDPALTPQVFHMGLRQRRSPIKQVLLSGEVVVGAGNIYASDALFEAGIDPRTRSDRIALARAARLLDAVRLVLAQAIEAGGSTLKDFVDAHGQVGQYQGQARVYGREGQACSRCGTTIRRFLQGQRATFYCPGCQH